MKPDIPESNNVEIEPYERGSESIPEFVAKRVQELSERSIRKNLNATSEPVDGFIHPESEVAPTSFGHGVRIDDPEIYISAAEKMEEFQELFPDSKNDESEKRRQALLATQYALQEYFGSPFVDPEAERMRDEFFKNKDAPVSIEYFRGKKSAACLERAAVAHNQLTFLGIENRLVNGVLKTKDGSENHAFITIGDRIYDPARPFVVEKPGNLAEVRPAVMKGADEFFENGSVPVTHKRYKVDEKGDVTTTTEEVEYSKWRFTGLVEEI